MDFKNVPKMYRPIPFWSWNEKLEVEETKLQIREMESAGMGGFFMHARGGLQTPYMGEEWFENVAASIEEAKACNMRPWAYDENGWPSGFGNGMVNEMGVEYQQKYLRMENELVHEDTFICKCGEHFFYYEINPFYVDTLDRKVTEKFLECVYKPYYERFGNEIEGFFTDEPQISRSGFPWSFVFEEEYRKRYGENILEHLEELFLPIRDYKVVRVKFWKMVTELFSENYMKQIYDWCDERGLKLTGHLLLEESTRSQLTTNGACMPHYEYFHIPGMDWLGRDIRESLTAIQVASAAEQLGKEAVLTETFAMCGHNMSFAELKGLYEWQMVRGINLLCQHLEGYSIRGLRKRDYPPTMFVQQPWWKEYGRLNEALSREGMILNEGKHKVDVLVIHPQTTAWSLFDHGDNAGLHELTQNLLGIIRTLEEKHIAFHLGDEILMERHGNVKNGKIQIGKQEYSKIICSACEILLPKTKELLDAFVKEGGEIILAEQLSEREVIDVSNITYTSRELEDCNIHFFVNSSKERIKANVKIKGKKMDIYTGELEEFSGCHEFEPWGSLMIVESNDTNIEEKQKSKLISADGKFLVSKETENCITLDCCDYYFDGELQEKNGYVINICERASSLEKPVKIHQDYFLQLAYIPEKLHLACETPKKFDIKINGKLVEQNVDGYFVDKSFKKIDIAKYLQLGDNVISFDCMFKQSNEVYSNRRKAFKFESEKNKLAFDFEIEPIYLVGKFGVKTDGKWTKMENNSVCYHGQFVVDKPIEAISPKNIEQQGFPFFCGELILEGDINIQGENPVLDVNWKGINALRVEINGKEKVMLTDNRLSLKDFGVIGETKVKFTLINNLRNLLGPHHLETGEQLAVRPRDFYKEPCVWRNTPPVWNEGYCFVETGIS